MDLNKLFHDLEKPRIPKEMEEYFHHICSITEQNKELTELARLKKDRYKKFLEEFYPLYCFSKSKYCKEASRMNIVIGNQGYDAVVIYNDGSKEKYEITGYIDGEWDFLNAKELNESCIGIVTVDGTKSIAEKQKNYFHKIMGNVKKKAEKDYSGMSIIFVVNTYWHFEVFDCDSSNFISDLMNKIRNQGIIAKKVFLLRLRNQGMEEIDKNLFVV
jgi:hypothetical protein